MKDSIATEDMFEEEIPPSKIMREKPIEEKKEEVLSIPETLSVKNLVTGILQISDRCRRMNKGRLPQVEGDINKMLTHTRKIDILAKDNKEIIDLVAKIRDATVRFKESLSNAELDEIDKSASTILRIPGIQ